MTNRLYYGDNLDWLSNHQAFPDGSVDLVYLDPPFNSNATYSQLFKSPDGKTADSQIEAFEDTWTWGVSAEAAYERVVRGPNTDVALLLQAMRSFLHDNALMAYLAMMAARLVELHRVLKDTGSLYLHCDPTASHYLKLLLDGVFGAENFRSEIIWRRSSSHNNVSRKYGPIHDVILFYARTETHRLNNINLPHNRAYIEGEFRYSDKRGVYRLNEIMGPDVRTGDSGKPWNGYDPTPRKRHWAIPEELKRLLSSEQRNGTTQEQLDALLALDEIVLSKTGRPKYKQRPTDGGGIQDIWAFQPGTEGALFNSPVAIDQDVKWLSNEKEKLGYPTQKPLGLLERIISASSNPGDVVLDPFCGCGTAVHAAEKLGRRWLGIDITHLSIALIEKRMRDAFPGIEFDVEGRPKDLASALELAARDKHEFQKWAVTHIGGQPWKGGRKGPDGGIDGLIFFNGFEGGKATHEKAIISVKGGLNKNVNDVASLVETIGREKAALGILLAAALPTKQMEARAAAAGFYDPGMGLTPVPRIQILTLAELFAGKRPVIPNVNPAMFKAAPVEAKAQGRLEL